MTRLRRRAPRRRPEELEEGLAYHLLLGSPFLRGAGFGDVEESPDADVALRDAWNANRVELLAGWIAENPRSRPYAWWRYDAPEPRRRTDGNPHPFDDPRRQAAVDRAAAEYGRECWLCRAAFRLHYGTPQIIIGDGCAEYESEAAYLERLGLLEDSERRFVGFRP